jgi:multiple sugar transport system permease protein
MAITEGTTAVRPKAKTRGRLSLSNTQFSLLLMVPALALLTFTILYPLVRGIILSFESFSLVALDAGVQWVGLDNFKTLLTSSAYREVWMTTLIFVVASVGGQFLLGFATALVLNQDLAQRNLVRGLLLMPWIVPTVVASLLFKWIYNQQYGVFNYLLKTFTIIPVFRAWIGDPQLALFSVILANIWKGFPFHMIVLLAALQTIPSELFEAATIDGASAVQRFRYVTLPHLRYIIMIDVLISIIWTFQSFTMIWTMTEGGPITATTTLAISIYRTAFQAFDIGMGAAIGTIWLVVMAIFSVVFVRLVGGTSRIQV